MPVAQLGTLTDLNYHIYADSWPVSVVVMGSSGSHRIFLLRLVSVCYQSMCGNRAASGMALDNIPDSRKG